MGDKRLRGRENGCSGWIHNVCILLDETDGGVSTGRGGGSTLKNKVYDHEDVFSMEDQLHKFCQTGIRFS